MLHASLAIDPRFTVAPVNRRTFGSFVEHMGRCVYTGIYEPGHPSADEDGFRTDVLDLTREMGVSMVRYPGGNFVSGYRWEDGVGPVEDRPKRRDAAWHSIETNEFGLDEFARWARKADVEVMYALNLGTRGLQEALDLQEYLNHPEGTWFSDLRRSHGVKEPYGITLFCLGNEMDGPWQTGHKTAAEYGRIATEVAAAMRAAQPDLELVACGSSSSFMPTFGAWESTVLEHAYDHVDLISAHAYYEQTDLDLGTFLASAVNMDHFVESVVATADAVRARLGRKKRINISFDEWNVWYLSRLQATSRETGEWELAPRLSEDAYDVADAVVVGNLLMSLLRHSDRVTAACQAQLVNCIAPIRSEPGGPAWRQTIFHPFAATARLARGTVLRVETAVATYETQKYGEAPLVDAVATHDEESGEVSLFAVNRSVGEPAQLSVDLRAFPGLALAEASGIWDDDVHASNSQEQPDRVAPRPLQEARVEDGRLVATLPPVSWTALRLAPART